ncbi:MAG: hypothetical protein KJ065_06470 [Anaerolineae bacterium]|nr:hypothetical protein [Anaerolineae bacterium]
MSFGRARVKVTEAERSAIKDEMRAILIEQARTRQTITYGELAGRLTTVTLHPHSFVFTRLLQAVCDEEERAGHGQLCALVVSKATGMPSGGYFGMAAKQDLSTGDLEARWQEDLQTLFDHWAAQ